MKAEAAMPEPLRAWLQELQAAKQAARAHGYRRTVTNTRESWDLITRRFVTEVPPIEWICDEIIPGPDYRVPARVYDPQPDEALPVALFVHGGGHVSGSVSLYDPIARKLALAIAHIIVAIDYRLAPECPYPAQLKDTLASAKRVFPLLDRLGLRYEPRLSLIGDSGGGALCATVAHLSQFEPGLKLAAQVLIYPSLDYSLSQPSVIENAEGYLLERDRVQWMFDAYLQNAENRRAVSPLFMELTADYPPTLVITAGFCPLRDEGQVYAERLNEQGIPVEAINFPGMVHGFLNLENLVSDACAQVYAEIGRFLTETALANETQSSPASVLPDRDPQPKARMDGPV
ncbi:carboxylesterase [Halochromatium glycolicum]|uniref:Carboxylesterase n=2 Tax=Halochromatium glycolicum TaxID=85075 RepID=A0AAJ0U7Y7_9GAMM|nr:carboxylesterase [Halochromatium glycolicum]